MRNLLREKLKKKCDRMMTDPKAYVGIPRKTNIAYQVQNTIGIPPILG